MNKKNILCFSLIFFLSFLSAQEEDKNIAIIKYGLESEVIELIKQSQNNKDDSFNTAFQELFYTTKSVSIKNELLTFFAHAKIDGFSDYANEIISDPVSYKRATVLSALTYIKELKVTNSLPYIKTIIESENSEYRDLAIALIGNIGLAEDVPFLIHYLQNEDSYDEKTKLVIRQNVMSAIAQIGAEGYIEEILEILNDTDENAYIRASACVALGKTQSESVAPSIIALLEESDPVLRTAAVKALGFYNTLEKNNVITESLRDSYYKVRLEALEKIQENKINDAALSVLYRAKNDPEEVVKFKSIEVLGVLQDSDGIDWMVSELKDDKKGDKLRIKIASVLYLSNTNKYYETLENLIRLSFKDDKKTTFRNELLKIVTKEINPRLDVLAIDLLQDKDAVLKSFGLDIYEKNKFNNLTPIVESLAQDEKLGAISKRAKKILDKK